METSQIESSKQGILYVVATPIGNLGDMVPRAVETLQQVDLIAAEDTRHSTRLLAHFHISTPMVAYHNHNEGDSAQWLIDKISRGQSIALISDAGTPLISDPGYRLVKMAQESSVRVIPIPGASALITALSAVGLPSDRFIFEGFLPAKATHRQKQLELLKNESRTLIFYEAPHRIEDCLTDMADIFGEDRRLGLARELTKTFETIVVDSAKNIAEFVASDANQRKGEIVIVVHGVESKKEAVLNAEVERILKLLLNQLPPKQATALAADITGVDKKILYNWAVENK
ncbi:MAG: 16S rRNA (cytidine(1402)-2'-O)-methyltransferase [Cellvibrionaceae bacterium]